jgi:hypothetical protein
MEPKNDDIVAIFDDSIKPALLDSVSIDPLTLNEMILDLDSYEGDLINLDPHVDQLI